MGFKSVKNRFKEVKEKIKEEQDSSGGGSYGNDNFFRPKPVKGEDKTKFRFRILDLEEESTLGRPWMKIFYHMFEREGDRKYIKCIDPRTFDKNADNPIADLASKLFSSDNAMDKGQASKLYRKPRYFLKVYIKDVPDDQLEYKGKVLIYEASKTVYDKLIDEIEETEEDEAPFWDPFEGKDFILAIKTKKDTKSGREWPDYSDSKFVGSGKPIVDDEDLMDELYEAHKKLSVKEEVLNRNPLMNGTALKQLLEGGLDDSDGSVDNQSASNLTDDADLDDFDLGDEKKDEAAKESSSEDSTPDEISLDEDEIDFDDLDIGDDDLEDL